MDLDLKESQNLILGSLLREREVWPAYAAAQHPIRHTLTRVALPAAVVAALGSFLLGLVFSSYYLFGAASIGTLLHGLIVAVGALFIWAAAAYYFAGLFQAGPAGPTGPPGPEPTEETDAAEAEAPDPTESAPATGPRTLDQAFAAVTFGLLPGFVGMLLQALPLVGALIALVAGIYALMTLYRALPVFLPIAEGDRTKHFVATFIAALVATLVLSALLGALLVGSVARDVSQRADAELDRISEQVDLGDEAAPRSLPDLLGVEGQVASIEDAADDDYTPPADGELTRAQVERTVRLLARTEEVRHESGKRLEAIADKSEGEGEEPSLGDLFTGIRGLVNIGTAEMQVIKAAGANWAEHEWVKQQLTNARLSPEDNAHNYELYQAFEEELENLL